MLGVSKDHAHTLDWRDARSVEIPGTSFKDNQDSGLHPQGLKLKPNKVEATHRWILICEGIINPLGQENFAFASCVLAFICVHLRFIGDNLRSHQCVYDIINITVSENHWRTLHTSQRLSENANGKASHACVTRINANERKCDSHGNTQGWLMNLYLPKSVTLIATVYELASSLLNLRRLR
ncbi:hypothetical protein EV421DRAFT_1741022 [Armillaria borealis]|uniref:Uncharacterized protein n=1 Tax=Armillaria borealis TaxID=47425 RepID=A0AA39J131_9AGAR|nr:hypothetical protein EV421DRAFT_1741022 [Armillaria borealis]